MPPKGKKLGSLLLGLYDQAGLLHHVGFCSGLTAAEVLSVLHRLQAVEGPPEFTGNAPGGPSRWSQGRSTEWQSLRHELVVDWPPHRRPFPTWHPPFAGAQTKRQANAPSIKYPQRAAPLYGCSPPLSLRSLKLFMSFRSGEHRSRAVTLPVPFDLREQKANQVLQSVFQVGRFQDHLAFFGPG